jgi:hypothetical protein
MDNYHLKYLKYKMKYLELKGGANKFKINDDNIIYKSKKVKIIGISIDGNFYKIQEIEDPLLIHDAVPEEELIFDERDARVTRRAVDPRDKIILYFKTTNFDEIIEKHKLIVKDIIENPYDKYLNLRERLQKYGADADFPEFEGVIGYLTKTLFQNESIVTFFNKPEYSVLIEQLVNKLISIQIDGRFNYPYRATIYCIESMLELIDLYYRNTITYDKSKQINENIGPYYHIFRYRSYMITFTDSEFGIPNNIIFPTIANIGAVDLIKIRCVPILFMGVINEPIYIDQYLNSPLDFWAHDIQHSKRQIQETLRYYDNFIKHNQYFQRRTLFDIRTELDFYKYMEQYTKDTILPIIKINRLDTKEERALKAIKKLIIFEVVHEKAWPITEKSLCRNIPLRYDEFPVENIKLNEETNKISTFHYLFADPTTIGNVIGKIRSGFYDLTSDPKSYIVPKDFRTSQNVSKASLELLHEINCSKIPSFDYLLSLSTDRHAMQEMADVKQIDIPDIPAKSIPYPDDSEQNLYDDKLLYSIFTPKIGIKDKEKQDQLHKLDDVLGYDPTFEQLGK